MYQDKIGQYSMARRTRVMPQRLQSEQPLQEQSGAGRLCNGSQPEIGTQEKTPITDGQSRRTGWGLEGYPLAMVYAPYQQFKDIYEPDRALARGTLFAELDLPFEGGKKGR